MVISAGNSVQVNSASTEVVRDRRLTSQMHQVAEEMIFMMQLFGVDRYLRALSACVPRCIALWTVQKVCDLCNAIDNLCNATSAALNHCIAKDLRYT